MFAKVKTPAQPPRKIVVPKGATGLGYIPADGENHMLHIGDYDLTIRAQKRTNIAPGLSKVQFQGLFYAAHNERIYIFLVALEPRIAEGVFSLSDPRIGNVLVNASLRRRAVKSS